MNLTASIFSLLVFALSVAAEAQPLPTPAPTLGSCKVDRFGEWETTVGCSGAWRFTVHEASGVEAAASAKRFIEVVEEQQGFTISRRELARNKRRWQVIEVKPRESPSGVAVSLVFVTISDGSPLPRRVVTCEGTIVGVGSIEDFCGPVGERLLEKSPEALGLALPRPLLFGTEVLPDKSARVEFVWEEMWNVVDGQGGRLYVTHVLSDSGRDVPDEWLQSFVRSAHERGDVVDPIVQRHCLVGDRRATCRILKTTSALNGSEVTTVALFPRAGAGSLAGYDVLYHCAWRGESAHPGRICSGSLRFVEQR